MSDTKQKLREMAQLTVLSNRISEIHEKNLRAYAAIFFNAVKSVKIEYDVAPINILEQEDKRVKSASTISYYFDLDEKENDHLEKRFEALENALKALFWSDLTVEIYFNDRIVFKSKKNERK